MSPHAVPRSSQGAVDQPVNLDWRSVAAPILAGEFPPLVAVRTVVTKWRPRALLGIGNYVRVSGRGPLYADCLVSKTYIGPASLVPAYAWQFSAATAITWAEGGAPVTLIGQDDLLQSDGVPFVFDKSTALCVATEYPVGAVLRYGFELGDNVISYFKDGVSEAASLAKAADYTPLPGFAFTFDLIEGAVT